MMGYAVGMLALVPLLERFDCRDANSMTLQLENLRLGDLRFLSGTVRLEVSELPNGQA